MTTRSFTNCVPFMRDIEGNNQNVFKVASKKDVICPISASNAIWRTSVCGSYWSANLIAQDLLGIAGDKIVSERGRFWKRAKQALRSAITRHSDYRTSYTDAEVTEILLCLDNDPTSPALGIYRDCNDPRTWGDGTWDRMFEQLRNSFTDVLRTATIPDHRNYWLAPAWQALALGQWMALYKKSCHWSSYAESFRPLLAGKGWMIKGMWSNYQPTIQHRHERRVIDNFPIHIPRFTDYRDDADDGCPPRVVRAWLQPLDNGLLALYNGYICSIGSDEYDFTTRTRHHIFKVDEDVAPLIALDIATYIGLEAGSEIGVRKVVAPDSNAYINSNRWYLIGDPAHDYMNLARGTPHLDFRREVRMSNDTWEEADPGCVIETEQILDNEWHASERTEYGDRYGKWLNDEER